jgi:LL-diaminopimelate aminotransferase
VQRAAEAVYSEEGKAQVRELSDFYLTNARLVRESFEKLGFATSGGVHSPYIWIHVNQDSWEFFDYLLDRAGVVITPGSGFGKCGEGYIRASSFGSRENTVKGMEKIAEAGAP